MEGATLVGVADGAGGVSGGAATADAFCRALRDCVGARPAAWEVWMAHLDGALAASGRLGLAAAVVVEIRDDATLLGASVGDCEASILLSGEWHDLTGGQQRKPLFGSGQCRPVAFSGSLAKETLVIGTDGLWKYAPREQIREAASRSPLDAAATALVDGVRLQSGRLQDDIAVLVGEWSRSGDS
jgi:serine/threonine protein phosphatase PrpC